MQRTRNNKYFLAAAVALLTFIVYLPALRNEFVYWDDNLYIFENPPIRSLDASFFRWAFLDFHASNWHPLTWISHAVDYALWGLNPLGHHLTSILLHAINTALVVLLALKLRETARIRSAPNTLPSFLNDRTVLIAAGTTGLLFGLHPVHVESVAWVAERKDLLCALFFLLSIMAYVYYAVSQQSAVYGPQSEGEGTDEVGGKNFFTNKQYLLSFVLFVFALMSKPMAVTLPVVLLILDWYPVKRIRSFKTFWTATIEKTPFIVLSVVSSLLTILAQKAGGSLSSIDKIPLSIRVPVAAKSLMAYLGKMLMPQDLIPFYPYPKDASLFSFEYGTSIIMVIGITTACVMLAKKQKVWLSVWGYYVITLIPVLGIIQVGGQSMADRYTYLPSLGPFLIVGLCTAGIAEKVNDVKSKNLLRKVFSFAAGLLLITYLTYLTVEQTAVWRNSIGLWTYVIEKEPGRVPLAYNNRGLVYYKTGQFDKAAADFQEAVTLRPSYLDAYSNLGMAYYQIGRMDRAIENFDKAISLEPAYYKAYNNRAMTLGKMGRLDDAIADYRRAIALNPSSPQTYFNLGILHAQAGLFDQAIESFSRSLAADPAYADAYSSRALAYTFTGQYDRALDDFARALAMVRNPATVHFNRGNLYLKIDRKELALADFQKSCYLGDEMGCSVMHQLTQGANQR